MSVLGISSGPKVGCRIAAVRQRCDDFLNSENQSQLLGFHGQQKIEHFRDSLLRACTTCLKIDTVGKETLLVQLILVASKEILRDSRPAYMEVRHEPGYASCDLAGMDGGRFDGSHLVWESNSGKQFILRRGTTPSLSRHDEIFSKKRNLRNCSEFRRRKDARQNDAAKV